MRHCRELSAVDCLLDACSERSILCLRWNVEATDPDWDFTQPYRLGGFERERSPGVGQTRLNVGREVEWDGMCRVCMYGVLETS